MRKHYNTFGFNFESEVQALLLPTLHSMRPNTLSWSHSNFLPAWYMIRIANLIWHDCWSICFSVFVYVSLFFSLSFSISLSLSLCICHNRSVYLCLTLLLKVSVLQFKTVTPEFMYIHEFNFRTLYKCTSKGQHPAAFFWSTVQPLILLKTL